MYVCVCLHVYFWRLMLWLVNKRFLVFVLYWIAAGVEKRESEPNCEQHRSQAPAQADAVEYSTRYRWVTSSFTDRANWVFSRGWFGFDQFHRLC